jgi:ABC-type spermidine/putrescine transport system, permease component II
MKKKTSSRLRLGYLILIITLMYLPLITVVIFSFNSSKYQTRFTGFSFQWYLSLFKNERLTESLINSLILAFSTTLLSAIIGTLGALGLAKTRYKLNRPVSFIATLPLMIPEIILGMVFLAFFTLLSLPFGFTTLLIGHTAFCVPYIMIMVSGALRDMDKALEEAARDLGAGRKRAFFDITLPLLAPSIAAGSILAFAMSFDDVVISVFVNSPHFVTLPVRVYTQLKTGVTPEINALCTIMLALSVIAVILYSKLTDKKEKHAND